jgi:hypothetical protein
VRRITAIVFIASLLGSCAAGQLDKNIQRATDVAKGFVEVHNNVQDIVHSTQEFCAVTYVALAGNEDARKNLEKFCDRMDILFDEIQSVEKKILKEETCSKKY